MSGARGGDPLPRRFVALRLESAAATDLVRAFERALDLGPGDPGPRWLRRVHPLDLHLTLFFLGAAPPEACRAAWEGARPALAGLELAPEGLVLDRLGAFPRPGAERVLWAGLGGPGLPALARVREAVCAAAVAAGFEADPRPWAPHVTLARVRGGPGGRGGRGGRGGARPDEGGAGRVPPAFHAAALAIPWRPETAALMRGRPAGERTEDAPQAYAEDERLALSGA